MSTDPDERSWELVEQFDYAARRGGPLPALIAEVAATCDPDIRLVLLVSLESLAEDDRSAAIRYADHLLALAARLPDVAARQIRAGVDLALANAAAAADDWAETKVRLTRAEHDIAELLPTCHADWAWTMGCAVEDDRGDEARHHWQRARELFIADGRWSKAASVSESLALLHGGGEAGVAVDVALALAEWGAAADQYAAAELPEQVQQCLAHAMQLLTRAVESAEPGDKGRTHGWFMALRGLALRHGAALLAAKMAVFAGVTAAETRRTLDDARALFTTARAELQMLGHSNETRLELAFADYFEASMLSFHNRYREMEPLLHAAIPVLRAEGLTAWVAECEAMLTVVLCMVERTSSGSRRSWRNQRWPGAGGNLVVSVRAVTLIREGRLTDAIAALTERSEHASGAGAPFMAAYGKGLAALAASSAGDTRPARHSVVEISRLLTDDARLPVEAARHLSALRLLLLIDLAPHDRDGRSQLRLMMQLEELLLSFGSGLMAASHALRRAQLLMMLGKHRAAVQAGLPAVLALDAVRFTLPDARRRSRWAVTVTHGFDTVLRAATGCGDATLVAELLEVVRGNAVPLPGASSGPGDDITQSLGELLDEVAPTDVGGLTPVGALTGAQLLAGGESRTVLGLPPYVRTPWNTVALAEPLRLARRYHDPVRADITVDWVV